MPHSYIEAIQTDTSVYANLQDLSFGVDFWDKVPTLCLKSTMPRTSSIPALQKQTKKKQELLASSGTISNPSLPALNDSEAG